MEQVNACYPPLGHIEQGWMEFYAGDLRQKAS